MTLSSLKFFFYPCWCLTASVAMGDVQFWSSKCLLKAPELPKDLIRSVTHQVSLFLGLHLWICVELEVLGTLFYSLTPSWPAHQLHNLLKASLTITCWKMTLSSLNFFFCPCWCLFFQLLVLFLKSVRNECRTLSTLELDDRNKTCTTKPVLDNEKNF